jgi:rhodanese-related sulfurtransferase
MGQLAQFIVNHWPLWLAFILLLLCVFINELITQKKRAKSLSTAAAVLMMNHEGASVIDLREQDAYRAGHIIDAIRSTAEDFKQQRMDKYKNKTFILVCTRGLQSAELANKLRTQGFANAMVLAGGMTAWQEAGLPIVKK